MECSYTDFFFFQFCPQYQNERGGRIVLQAIAAPSLQEWGNAHDALQAALDLEKQVNQVRYFFNHFFLAKQSIAWE